MARSRKAAANGSTDASPSSPPTTTTTSSESSAQPQSDGVAPRSSSVRALLAPATGGERDEVKVNNASVTELKHACDDALKRFLSRPDLFKQIHTHTDVRLALGWASVLVAGATGLYGWKVEFEKSKPVVWVGLILYALLTIAQTLYAYFVERDIVFVGKRKTLDKRIVTERITLRTTSTPSTPSSPAPSYALTISYVRSAAGGKTLLSKGRAVLTRGFNAFFDEEGVMDQEAFERWVGEGVGDVMEGKGGKVE